MCGIFGWQFHSVGQVERAVVAAVLAQAMDRRGGHSWGVYDPLTDKLKRGLGDISTGLRVAWLTKRDCVMAHTRYATTGRVTRKNAHPFRFRDLVGAHNGMVSNHTTLNATYGRRCQVDSQHIFLHIEAGECLTEVEGYGTIEYVDRNDRGKVFLAHFNGGDLAVWQGDFGLVWASTKAAVKSALHMAGLRGRRVETQDGVLFFAEGGRLNRTEMAVPVSPFVRELRQSRLVGLSDDFPDLEELDPDTGLPLDDLAREQRDWERLHGRGCWPDGR